MKKTERITVPKPVPRFDKGADMVLKITAGNNQRLSSQADGKAHILIQVNSIIISVMISVLFGKMEDHSNLVIPCIMMIIVNVVTIIFSILATRPTVPRGVFTSKDVDQRKVNLLFFGNFYKMKLKDYLVGMQEMVDNNDFLYECLMRDIYFQGVALGRKYFLLRLSYDVFMFGLVISVITFIAAFFF